MLQYHGRKAAVRGGDLYFGIWGERGPLILASHGLTANHIGFQALAEQLGNDFRLVAPDHRGRGRSRDITGPWGMGAHADDLFAILDELGEARADLLIGHSMGGFVAAVAGARAPQRFGGILFIDGGLPTIDKMPEGLSPEALVQAVIGPALDRLDMRFGSLENYLAFWRKHPAFASEWSPYVEQYAAYDLIGNPPDLRSSTVKPAIIADVQTQLVDNLVPQALARLQLPASFLSAPRGIMNTDPLYAPEVLQDWARRTPGLELKNVEDVNHYTIVLSETGARAIAAEIRALLARTRQSPN